MDCIHWHGANFILNLQAENAANIIYNVSTKQTIQKCKVVHLEHLIKIISHPSKDSHTLLFFIDLN